MEFHHEMNAVYITAMGTTMFAISRHVKFTDNCDNRN